MSCFPRIRGDVPTTSCPLVTVLLFSPHTRGCSVGLSPVQRDLRVFPAYAGMFLDFQTLEPDLYQFSPHTRGCSRVDEAVHVPAAVFPAYAGMFRRSRENRPHPGSFPRIRGDVPLFQMLRKKSPRFSPHTRGCSFLLLPANLCVLVFPAYAGMFLAETQLPGLQRGFPRIRGDVPKHARRKTFQPRFSPHTRGCSPGGVAWVDRDRVFPAYAGMFLCDERNIIVPFGFPRIRGDVPPISRPSWRQWGFSPHTRGCSHAIAWRFVGLSVFPAYAGMFRRSYQPSNP